jgi:hypothetical protein
MLKSLSFDPIRNALSFLLKGANGTKVVQLGLAQTPYVGVNPEPGGSSPFQLKARHSRVQSINPAGSITVRLPNDVRIGEMVRIENRDTNPITLQTSNGTTIEIFRAGYVTAIALQDNPVGSSQWKIMEEFHERSGESVSIGTATNATSVSATADYIVTRNYVLMVLRLSYTISATGNFSFEITLPSGAAGDNAGGGSGYGRNSGNRSRFGVHVTGAASAEVYGDGDASSYSDAYCTFIYRRT